MESRQDDSARLQQVDPAASAENSSTLRAPRAWAAKRAAALTAFVGDAVRFYRRNSARLGRCLLALLPEGMARRDVQREIELVPRRLYGCAERSAAGWSVSFPPSCVVCGKETDGEWLEEKRTAVDLTWTLAIPAALIFLSIVPGFCLLGVWGLPAAVVAGLALGYIARRQVAVHLRVKRCPEHESRRRSPVLHQFAGRLFLRVGHRDVKQQFLRQGRTLAAQETESGDSRRRALATLDDPVDPRASRGPIFAILGGWLWLAFGVLQFVASVIEFVGAMLLGLLTASASSSGGGGGSGGAVLVIFLLLGLYVLFRFGVALAFLRAGWRTVRGDATDTLSNSIASIGLGLLVLWPFGMFLAGHWTHVPGENHPNAISISSFPGMWVPLSFGISGLLLIVAGAMVLYDRGLYLGYTSRGALLFMTECPKCQCPVEVRGHSMVDSLHRCADCGEAFRIERIDG